MSARARAGTLGWMNDTALPGPWWPDLLLVLTATALALALRPWRSVARSGPPWPWIVLWAVMPLLWGVDRYVAVPIAQPMSGAALLVMLAGWPMAVLMMLPVAGLTAFAADLGAAEALHRLAWLGVVPATLMLGLGAAVRRWLPNHLFVYIFARAYLGSFIACGGAAGLALLLGPLPAGSQLDDLWLVRPIAAFGEAFLTGMLVAILVAYRPSWLATYSDRLYLPK
jgi:uncharacterized membrane protein